MDTNGTNVATAFEELGDLEKEFAQVELDALRRKEYASKRLYDKRQTLLNRVPDFWPSVFANGPEEVQQFFAPTDLAILASLKSFFVDRYQIESETKGDPRSLRFTFEFADNEYFEDSKLVKEFEYKPRHSGPGSLISQPVPIKWKSKKKDVTDGLLAAAVELHAAEDALKLKKGDKEVEIVDRESLWQYEKLREKLVKLDDESPEEEASFFNWFGFRGAVDLADGRSKPAANGNNAEGDGSDDEESEQAITLEVEIFPAGEEVANALAEELWTDAMDYFMSAQEDDGEPDFDEFDEDDEDSEDEAPRLVPAEEIRPRKRQRKD